VIYSLNPEPSFEIRFDSLDFFGSFFHQGKNEQEEVMLKMALKQFKLCFYG
jgi:hypothetical protein